MPRLRAWWKEKLERDGPHDLHALAVDSLVELTMDKDFCCAFTRHYLPGLSFQIGERLSRDVPHYRHTVGTRLMTSEQLRHEIETEETPWARWIHPTNDGAPVPLLDMTRPQLLAASEDRKRRGDTNYKDAAFFKAIADTLTDAQAVGDVWRANDLADLYERISLKIKADVVLVPALTRGAER